MNFTQCFKFLTGRMRDEIIVTSAGNCSELWWELTQRERARVLSRSLHEPRLAVRGRHRASGSRHRNVVAFSGDGAFCMNPGMLMVERQLALPNLKHFLVSNRCYGSTNELAMPFADDVDYAAHGTRRRHRAGLCVLRPSTASPRRSTRSSLVPGHVFAVLDVEPLGRRLHSPPLDGPELKFRFGRYLERTGSPPIFDAPLHRK